MASEVPLSPRARGHAPSPASGTFPPAVCLKLMGSLDSLQLSPGCTCASERLLRAGEEREQRGLFPMTVAVVVFFWGGRRRLLVLFHNVDRISCGLRPSQPLLTQTFSPRLALDACPG